MVNPRIRQPVGALLTIPKQQPRPLSAFEDFNESSYTPYSRPTSFSSSSEASSPRYNMTGRPPTLNEILLDTAPPPWTLSAFMAYLSQNHCMETLEFTLDAQRYASVYEQSLADATSADDGRERVCAWWEKLMQVYIVPCAPREVNIPAQVRDRLLRVPYGPNPPHPSELAEAGRIIYELMNDSVLVPFLHGADVEPLSADSEGNSPSVTEPMTPPTTPPTSEWTFSATHGGFHRAVAAHNKGWKKVGAKLGFNRKSSNRRTTPTSSGPESGESSYNPSSNSSF
ncbi:regulator of G protein signaling domain-containing protein [Trichoderma breve]|uniref:Regulator of G protein signaling domain-containing protein n=1 Tax=Trichoderma breve TaxID=2034170 RepID=A0A9W9E446_9HYPO|nr:regulator of G protein signaling domain-containing protein [Trichoderma breve]KAJ4857449.1 regulator of G protein signaling domain-containing protein [Trichoderma breve]